MTIPSSFDRLGNSTELAGAFERDGDRTVYLPVHQAACAPGQPPPRRARHRPTLA